MTVPGGAADGSERRRRGVVFVVLVGVLSAELWGLVWAIAPAALHRSQQPAGFGFIVISGFVLILVAAVSLASGMIGSLAGYLAARLAILVRVPPVPVLAVVGGLVGWSIARFLLFDLGSTPDEAAQLPIPPAVASSVCLAVVWALCRRGGAPHRSGSGDGDPE